MRAQLRIQGGAKGVMPPPPVPVKTSHKKRWPPSAAPYISMFLGPPPPPSDHAGSDAGALPNLVIFSWGRGGKFWKQVFFFDILWKSLFYQRLHFLNSEVLTENFLWEFQDLLDLYMSIICATFLKFYRSLCKLPMCKWWILLHRL